MTSPPALSYPQGARRWIIVVTVITAAILELLNTSIVNVALKDISGNLGATQTEVAWVITAYAIANVIIIPLSGFLANQFGRRNYFAFSISLFTVASFFCGNASSMEALIFWRVLQGLGGGALLPTSQTVLVETFPPDQISTANTVFGLGIILGPTFGPTLGGYLTDTLSWEWVFYINIPLGIAAALLASVYITDSTAARKPPSIDWAGMIFLVIGIGALQFVLEEGQTEDWFESQLIRIFTTLAVVGCGCFIWWEWRHPAPVVNLRVLRYRSVALGSALNLVFGIGIYAPLFLFPIFVQGILGWSAAQTGLMLLPGALLAGVCIAISGRLMSRGVNPKWFITLGFCCFILFSCLMNFSTAQSGFRDYDLPQLLRGMTNGLITTPIAVLALSGLKGSEIAQSAGITNMIRQLGGAFGVALVNIILAQTNPMNRTALLSYMTPYNDLAQERGSALVQGLFSRGLGVEEATGAATRIMDVTVNRQAAVLSFNEAYLWVGLLFVVTLPLIFLIENPKETGPVAAH